MATTTAKNNTFKSSVEVPTQKTKFPNFDQEIVLTILGIHDHGLGMAGVDVVRESNGEIHKSHVYSLLAELHSRGWVRSWREETQNPIPKRFYAITDQGRAAVSACRFFHRPREGTVPCQNLVEV